MNRLARFLVTLAAVLPSYAADAQNPGQGVKSIENVNLSTGGTGLYRPGKWGLIRVSLRNPNEQDVDLLSTTYFVEDPTLQYGRRLWMPAQSRMVAWHPLKMPELQEREQKMFDLRSMVLTSAAGGESMTSNEFGAMQFDQGFRVAANEPVTAMVTEPNHEEDQLKSYWATPQDLAQTARQERAFRHNFTLIGEPLFPAGEIVLDGLDHLVIASNRLVTDAAGVGGIRRWVAAGGRLWIMADCVSPQLLTGLLGDLGTVAEVDRVDLTSVHLESGPWSVKPMTFDRELERPVPFVRLAGDGLEVDFRVDGWPAAFWMPYGEGRVLVTTLGADGWVRRREPKDPPSPSGSNFDNAFYPSDPLSHLALQFFSPKIPPLIPAAIAEEEVRQMIGYQIPSRVTVLGTLVGFTCLLLLVAVEAGRRGHLEWTGWAVPALALLASGGLVLTGSSSRSTISASIAVIQSIQGIPGSDAVRGDGVAAVLTQEGQIGSLSGTQGGWMRPEMEGLEGTTRRLVWSDLDRWNWDNLTTKPGLRLMPFQSAGRVAEPLEAVAEFNEQGIAGIVKLPDGLEPGDAIIATSHGRIGVELLAEGRFKADANDVLSSGQYLSAGVLSDEQQRRSRLLAQALAPSETSVRPTAPTLIVWTDRWPAGISLLNQSKAVGAALVSIPLRWNRPVPGTKVSIPAPFLAFRETIGPDGLPPPGVYDVWHAKWVERAGAIGTWLAFTVPQDLLPIDVKSATVTMKVLGPMGRLELSGQKGSQRQSLHSWDNPVGTLAYEITDPPVLQLDSKGRLLIRLDAGVATEGLGPGQPGAPTGVRADPVSFWQFEDVSVRLSATVAPRE